MGWWSEQDKEQQLLLGDEALDIVGEMVSKVADAYSRSWGRKPLPEELARTLSMVVLPRAEELFSGVENQELAGVMLKFRKRPRTQKIAPGDYFSIPLPSGGYGFGIVRKVFRNAAVLVDLLDIRSRKVLIAN